MNDDELKKKLLEEIEKGQSIGVRLFALMPKTEGVLGFVVEEILKKYNRLDLKGMVYTSLKELAVNGTKANFKRTLFKEHNFNIDDDKSYEEGMKFFKKSLNEKFIVEYAKKGRLTGLVVEILIRHDENVLFIEVINNVAISKKEDIRIRSKFKKSMSYDDIAQFYMDAGDTSEGAGMGITLVTMLLKSSGIDPHGFRVFSNHLNYTTARLEIPLHDDYKSKRNLFGTNENESGE